MRRIVSALITCMLAGVLFWATPAWAAPQQVHLTTVKARHAQRHRPHKATKHRAPKRHRRSV